MENLTTIVWGVLGLVLMIIELVTTQFILLFFGIAALVVLLARLTLGLDHLPLELVLFSVTGLLGVAFLRKPVLKSVKAKQGGLGPETLTLNVGIPAHGEAQIEYQGTVWTALNDCDRALGAGERVFVSGTEGVKLRLSALPPQR